MTTGKTRRGGFTLVELLVVIGLMAVMGTISVSGYFAASRGMKTRGAVQDSLSFIRMAMQTAIADNTPTAVLFLNSYTGPKDSGGEMYGTAIAIKMAGRITAKANSGTKANGGTIPNLLVDEFADWNFSFPREASAGNDAFGVRLYNMRNIKTTAKQGLKGCSSLMNDWVAYIQMSDKNKRDVMLMSNLDTQQFCADFKLDYSGLKGERKQIPSDDNRRNGNDFRWGLSVHEKNSGDGLAFSQWQIGDAYGMEMGRFELPRGYIFGSSAPSDNGKMVAASTAALVFNPSDLSGANNYTSFKGISTLAISATGTKGGDGVEKVGEISSNDYKDQD